MKKVILSLSLLFFLLSSCKETDLSSKSDSEALLVEQLVNDPDSQSMYQEFLQLNIELSSGFRKLSKDNQQLFFLNLEKPNNNESITDIVKVLKFTNLDAIEKQNYKFNKSFENLSNKYNFERISLPTIQSFVQQMNKVNNGKLKISGDCRLCDQYLQELWTDHWFCISSPQGHAACWWVRPSYKRLWKSWQECLDTCN